MEDAQVHHGRRHRGSGGLVGDTVSEEPKTTVGAEAQVNKLGIPAVILQFQNGSMQTKVSLNAHQLDQEALMSFYKLLADTRDRALDLLKFEDWDTTPVLYMPDGNARCVYAEDHGGSVEDVVQCGWEAFHTNALHSFQPTPAKSDGFDFFGRSDEPREAT